MKRAIVLFNLGGPDGPDSVRPFLFNLFNDPAIIGAPRPIRWCLAQFLSRRRAPIAREIYRELGGGSPLLANTEAQARALEAAIGEEDTRCFIAMRYWHPFVAEAVSAVKEWGPDEVVLLPLYPQYSSTTTGSSLGEWERHCAAQNFHPITHRICCYPMNEGLAEGYADLIQEAVGRIGNGGKTRLLLSAHGLPKKVIDAGDPYQWQVERTAEAILDGIDLENLEPVVCYQSRVGPLEWIGPSTDDEIRRAGRDGYNVIVLPIAFVSEHSETLVEIEIEYRELAEKSGVARFERVPTVGTNAAFISGLADIVKASRRQLSGAVCGDLGARLCPVDRTRCPCRSGRSA